MRRIQWRLATLRPLQINHYSIQSSLTSSADFVKQREQEGVFVPSARNAVDAQVLLNVSQSGNL